MKLLSKPLLSYSTLAPGYEALHRQEQLSKAAIIAGEISLSKNQLLLDVGCGSGLSSELFNCIRIGIDPSEELVAIARKKGIAAIIGCAEKMPFKDNCFDAVICVSAAHNFHDPRKAFAEIARVAKPQAKIAVSLLRASARFRLLRALVREFSVVKKVIRHRVDEVLILGTAVYNEKESNMIENFE
ncbi:TPA: class I SAM-dependent methyltransferase [Candidatus Woesearchaeota archaeon]|nr:class I SAM-dependent methyltransferase [Candidatus Woesearchaeota archaeon]